MVKRKRGFSHMDDRLFRDAMGKFATGITIVTLEDKDEIFGITVNAFMSISLNPKLIAISIDEDASIYDRLQEAKSFGVSILKEEQKEIAMIFAKQIEKDREIDYFISDGIPVIKNSLATVTCRVKEKVKAGDHTIFIAEVTGLTVDEGEPVLYSGGSYRSVQPLD